MPKVNSTPLRFVWQHSRIAFDADHAYLDFAASSNFHMSPGGNFCAHAAHEVAATPWGLLKGFIMNKRLNGKFFEACPNWIEFVDSFPELDQDSLRDFLRRCVNPDLPAKLLVVLYEHDRARASLEGMLNFLLPAQVSLPKRYSLLKRIEPYLVVQLDGCPTTQAMCSGLRKNLLSNKSRVIAFAQKMYSAPLPPHLFADLRQQKIQMEEPDDFRDQIVGIRDWINAKPLPRPRHHQWTGEEAIA